MKKSKLQLRVYFWNPNGTNDIEIIDQATNKAIDGMSEALFGHDVNGDWEYIDPKAALRVIAVSPVTNGIEVVDFINKYFKKGA